jgi:hypothetical protein
MCAGELAGDVHNGVMSLLLPCPPLPPPQLVPLSRAPVVCATRMWRTRWLGRVATPTAGSASWSTLRLRRSSRWGNTQALQWLRSHPWNVTGVTAQGSASTIVLESQDNAGIQCMQTGRRGGIARLMAAMVQVKVASDLLVLSPGVTPAGKVPVL